MILTETIDYIETNLFDEINYDELARIMLTNKFNIMRIFSASTDYTLAEYIRIRRLSEAGKIISDTNRNIIDVGFDCGYSTAESFSKAYKKFHGLTPGETRKSKKFKYVPVWEVKEIEQMRYDIVNFQNVKFIGYGERFVGKAEERGEQDERFFRSTRRKQDALRCLRRKDDFDWWELLDNFDENGFELTCAVKPGIDVSKGLTEQDYNNLADKTVKEKYDNGFNADELKKTIDGFCVCAVEGKYARFISESKEFPMNLLEDFTKSVYSGIDSYGFERDECRPELLRVCWFKRDRINERHLELYLPIK